MKPEKVGISAWVFLYDQAAKGKIDTLEKKIRWGLVYPCPDCQEHYTHLAALHINRLAKDDASKWFAFARSEIARTDSNAHPATTVQLKNVDWHTYRYIACILHSYEPHINLRYCRLVKQFLIEWQPEYYGSSLVDWSSYVALWDILDEIYPRFRRRRETLAKSFLAQQ